MVVEAAGGAEGTFPEGTWQNKTLAEPRRDLRI